MPFGRLLATLVLAATPGCGDESATDTTPDTVAKQAAENRPPGHRTMVALLADLRARTPEENSYVGDREARLLRAALNEPPRELSPVARCRVAFRLAREELRLGREAEAIEQFDEANRLMALPEVSEAMAPDEIDEMIFQTGVAYLRLAETENCCLRHSPESCIIPIRGGGVHTDQAPSRSAIRHFTQVLECAQADSPMHLQARWLLNIAYMTVDGHPDEVPAAYLIPPDAFASGQPFPRFVNIASRLGLDTFSMCGGAVAGDFDGDDDLDLVVSTWDPADEIRFFRNRGDGSFEERTEAAGFGGIYGGLNLMQADYDNDGDLDVLVLRGAWLFHAGRHPNSLLRNDGDATFTDVTFEAGLGDEHYPTQTASWADYDNDGDLDLYVGNEHAGGVTAPCQLFRNDGDGAFTDVAEEAGVANRRFTKAVVWGDYDGDRLPDLYVSNLGADNRLYRNLGDGRFVDVAPELGVTRPFAGFPAWFWDIDNDGALDIFASSYSSGIAELAASYLDVQVEMELACLYRADGRGGFEEVAKSFGLTRPSTPMGSNFGDLDGDGYLDFYLGTGDPNYQNLMPNVMYRNDGGRRFADITTAGGFGHLQKGHAVVFADFDHDGDVDLFEQLGGAFPGDRYGDALYENPGFAHRWITVECVGTRSNRSAIGARIHVRIDEDGESRSVYRHVNSGGSFGGNPLRQTIGLGGATAISRLEVFWPTTGETQTFVEVPLDAHLRIVEGEGTLTTLPLEPVTFGG